MKIIDDNRDIIVIEIAEFTSWTVGQDGITKIIAYEENGQMASVIWFEVLKGEHTHVRVNGSHVTYIQYKKDSAQ